jgi:hypothetical protein
VPTVVRDGAFSIRIYFNDHPPPHVHVVTASGTVKVRIDREPPELIAIVGMTRQEAARAWALVVEHRPLCLRRWRGIHDRDG